MTQTARSNTSGNLFALGFKQWFLAWTLLPICSFIITWGNLFFWGWTADSNARQVFLMWIFGAIGCAIHYGATRHWIRKIDVAVQAHFQTHMQIDTYRKAAGSTHPQTHSEAYERRYYGTLIGSLFVLLAGYQRLPVSEGTLFNAAIGGGAIAVLCLIVLRIREIAHASSRSELP